MNRGSAEKSGEMALQSGREGREAGPPGKHFLPGAWERECWPEPGNAFREPMPPVPSSSDPFRHVHSGGVHRLARCHFFKYLEEYKHRLLEPLLSGESRKSANMIISKLAEQAVHLSIARIDNERARL